MVGELGRFDYGKSIQEGAGFVLVVGETVFRFQTQECGTQQIPRVSTMGV